MILLINQQTCNFQLKLIIVFIVSAWTSILEKADHFFIPCPFKYLSGYDCPGCGFQRALLALMKGEVEHSFHLYPPAVPILLTIITACLAQWRLQDRSKGFIRILFLITGSIIMINYIYKVYSGRLYS